MTKYAFREVLTIKGADKADPQKIGEALSVLAGAAGELTPAVVVTAAKNPRHILHRHFEWSDEIAANAYRLDQARTLIRSITVEDHDGEDGQAPAFISISDKGGTSYRTLQAVKGSADLQAKVLAQASRDLEAWQSRYRSLEDVCEIVRTAQDAIEKKRKKTTEARAQ